MSQEPKRLTLRDQREGTEEQVLIDEEEFPELVRLFEAPGGDRLQEEIARLLCRFWHARARRREVKLLAAMVMPGGREETVLVEDISRTGLKVAVDREVPLNLEELIATRLPLRVAEGEGGKVLELECEFVRTAAIDSECTHLAFRFKVATPDQEAALERLALLLEG